MQINSHFNTYICNNVLSLQRVFNNDYYEINTIKALGYDDSDIKVKLLDLTAISISHTKLNTIDEDKIIQYVQWLEEIRNHFSPSEAIGYVLKDGEHPNVVHKYIMLPDNRSLNQLFIQNIERIFNIKRYNNRNTVLIGYQYVGQSEITINRLTL